MKKEYIAKLMVFWEAFMCVCVCVYELLEQMYEASKSLSMC
jgi:hypothetical protein